MEWVKFRSWKIKLSQITNSIVLFKKVNFQATAKSSYTHQEKSVPNLKQIQSDLQIQSFLLANEI